MFKELLRDKKGIWKLTVCFMVVGFSMLLANDAMAITSPAAGSFAYDVYDTFVNGILNGPIGFVGGAAAVTYGGAVTAQGNYPMGVPAVLGGVIILKADAITQTLGMLV
jgi:hypothetical protein